MGRLKKSLIIVALALLVVLVVIGLRPDEPVSPNFSDKSGGPSFVVNVVKPRIARPFFGILPTKLEEKLEGNQERWFDHKSPGAKIISVGLNRLELSADGWALLIEIDDKGKVRPGSYLVYTREIGEKLRRLRCLPAKEAVGHLRATARAGSGELDGSFLVEVATCENDETGMVIEWPPAPLTVRGSFRGLPQANR